MDDMSSDQIYKQMEPKVKEALKRAFRPEFLNRLDEIILFRALTETDIIEIAEKFLNRVAASAKEHELKLEYTDTLKRYLAKAGFSKSQGARPLRRVIQKEIEDPLSEHILRGEFMPGDTIKADIKGEGDAQEIIFTRIESKLLPDDEEIPALPAMGESEE